DLSNTAAVTYVTTNGTALANQDYYFVFGTLVFFSGEATKTFEVPIIDDTLVEGNDTVRLTLSNPTGVGATLGTPNTAVLTIIDNDTAPQASSVQFSAATYSVAENGGRATITVNRTGDTSGTVSVNYYTTDGTANAFFDYLPAVGVLTFSPGE